MITRVTVHIQTFLNQRNVKYEPYGPWPHIPEEVPSKKACSEVLTDRVVTHSPYPGGQDWPGRFHIARDRRLTACLLLPDSHCRESLSAPRPPKYKYYAVEERDNLITKSPFPKKKKMGIFGPLCTIVGVHSCIEWDRGGIPVLLICSVNGRWPSGWI